MSVFQGFQLLQASFPVAQPVGHSTPRLPFQRGKISGKAAARAPELAIFCHSIVLAEQK